MISKLGIWLVIIAVASTLTVAVVRGVRGHFDRVNTMEKENTLLQTQNAQLTATVEFKDNELAIERKHNDRHLELVSDTSDMLASIQRNQRQLITQTQLTHRASTATGREDLNRRSAERWIQTYAEIESLSDWTTGVYDVRRPDPVRPVVE